MVFRGWIKDSRVEETRLDAGEISVHVVPTSNQITVAVAGRVTVDSSTSLRSALLDLLRRATAPLIVIDLSAVSYLDTSGLATLLEALKVARERAVKLPPDHRPPPIGHGNPCSAGRRVNPSAGYARNRSKAGKERAKESNV